MLVVWLKCLEVKWRIVFICNYWLIFKLIENFMKYYVLNWIFFDVLRLLNKLDIFKYIYIDFFFE